MSREYAAAGASSRPSRNLIFAGLAATGFANGISHRVLAQMQFDAAATVLSGFEISILVWIALVVSVSMIAGANRVAGPRDLAVAATAAAAIALPAAPLSWLAITGLGFYVAATSPKESRARRGAWILVALTVPMFWSRLLMSLLGDAILRVDGFLAGLILNTERTGNAIAFADGWGHFWIAPECSSLTNVSLAILCWVLLAQSVDRMRGLNLVHCATAVTLVVALNTLRLGVTGMSRSHYEIIHSPAGSAAFSVLTLATIVGTYLYAARHSRGRSHAASR